MLVAGAAVAEPLTLDIDGKDSSDPEGYITREWTWSSGTATTTFTAYGPSDQVNQLDPQDSTPDCLDCELASSIAFEPEAEVEPISDSD